MAKSGQKIEELYVAIGADLSELDADFALADKTVKEGMAQLNREKRKVKLQAEIEMTGLNEATDATKMFEIRQKALQAQMKISSNQVKITNAEYMNSVKTLGESSVASQRLEERLLREQKAYASLDAELKKLNADRMKQSESAYMPTGGGGAKGGGGSNGAAEAAEGYAVGSIGGKFAKTMGVLYAGYQTVSQSAQYIKSSVDESMNAGNAVYKLGQRYHITSEEAARLNMEFKLTGTDANEAVPALTRLDRQLLTAGANGNATTNALKKFGVTLESAPGVLLPMNQQLEQLAKGYERATEKGQAQEYVAEVLGQKGLALLPILSQLGDVQERLGKMKMTGLLDPEMAHRVFLQQQELDAQLMQLKLSAGAALLPVAEELLPKVIQGAADLADSISKNKDAIKDVADGFVAAGSTIIGVLKDVLGMLDSVGINIDNVASGIKRIRYMNGGSADPDQSTSNYMWGLGGAAVGGLAGSFVGFTGVGALAGYTIGDYLGSKIGGGASEYNNQQAAAKNKTATEWAKSVFTKDLDDQENEAKQQQLAYDAAQKAEEAKAAEIEKINTDLTAKLNKLRESQLETNLNAVDIEMQAYRDKGASEELIEQVTAERKAKIRQDFEDNTMSRIRAVWESSYQQKLEMIDKERRAFIKAGVDEVNAARWTEHEKRQAAVNEAKQAFKQQREMLDAMRAAMSGTGTQEQKMNNARMAMLAVYRKQNGITEDMRTSPEEMSMFSMLRKQVEENAWPGLEQDAWAKNMYSGMIPEYRGNQRSYANPNFMGGGGFIPFNRGTQRPYAYPQASGDSYTFYNEFHDNIMDDDVHNSKLMDRFGNTAADQMKKAKNSRWNSY